ncbi:hypothetical protein AAMO2058_001726800 [Amorphochlora amoebiformis]
MKRMLLRPQRFDAGIGRLLKFVIQAFGSTIRAALREYRMKNMREWQKKLGLQMDDDDDEPNEDSSNHDKQANVNAGVGDENLEAGKNGFVGDFGEKTDVDPVDVDMDMMKAAMGEVKDLEDTKKVGDENPPDGENDIMELVSRNEILKMWMLALSQTTKWNSCENSASRSYFEDLRGSLKTLQTRPSRQPSKMQDQDCGHAHGIIVQCLA